MYLLLGGLVTLLAHLKSFGSSSPATSTPSNGRVMVNKIIKIKKVFKKKRPTVADITGQMAVMAMGSAADDAANMGDDPQKAQEEQVEKPYYTWKYSEQDQVWHYYEWYKGSWWRRNLSWTRMTEYF